MSTLTRIDPRHFVHACAATAVLALMPMSGPAQHQMVTMETLLDRIQIQDLLTLYYDDLSRGAGHELADYFTEINGDTATAHVIWTGIMNEGIGERPGVYEQGREYSEFVKRDGRWLISRRYVSTDGRPPNRFDDTYYPREHR